MEAGKEFASLLTKEPQVMYGGGSDYYDDYGAEDGFGMAA